MILLITDVLFSTAAVIVVSVAVASVFAALWYVQPLVRREKKQESGGSS